VSVNPSEPVFFPDRGRWRKWLEKNHSSEKEIWLLLYKKKGGIGMTLDDAVEEAVCFGWIDSQLRRIDNQKHQLRFTRRRPGSIWSESNLRRVEKMGEEGRMTDRGACLVPGGRKGGRMLSEDVRMVRERDDLRAALDRSPEARRHFDVSARSHRVQYFHWILQAKKPETRRKRIAETVRLMEKAAPRTKSR